MGKKRPPEFISFPKASLEPNLSLPYKLLTVLLIFLGGLFWSQWSLASVLHCKYFFRLADPTALDEVQFGDQFTKIIDTSSRYYVRQSQVPAFSPLTKEPVLVSSLLLSRKDDPRIVVENISTVSGKKVSFLNNPDQIEVGAKLQSAYYGTSIRETIQFVLEHYKNRRKGWSDTFLQHIFDQALRDAIRSIYFQYRVFNDVTEKFELRGTLKIIRAEEKGKETLPVDENLNVNLPYNGGLKFEAGNFAVDKNVNIEGTAEILIQLMAHAFEMTKRPNHESNKMMYYTYADRFSKVMYDQLGFKPIPGLEAPIEKDGTLWTPMGISAEDVLRIPEFLSKKRPNRTEDEMYKLSAEFKKLLSPSIETSSREWNKNGMNIKIQTEKNSESSSHNVTSIEIHNTMTMEHFYFKVDSLPLPLVSTISIRDSHGRNIIEFSSGTLTLRKFASQPGEKNVEIEFVTDEQVTFVSDIKVDAF